MDHHLEDAGEWILEVEHAERHNQLLAISMLGHIKPDGCADRQPKHTSRLLASRTIFVRLLGPSRKTSHSRDWLSGLRGAHNGSRPK
jgi:hypothetical protein